MVRLNSTVLEESTVREVHALLAGRVTRLAECLEAAHAADPPGAATWVVPVTPRTVHRLAGLDVLASHAGVSLCFQPATGLTARETTFYEDFLLRGPSRHTSPAVRLRAVVDDNLVLLRQFLRIAWNLTSLGARPVPLDGGRLDRALLVGQYGGEHVGDLAILGGVLLRLHREHGTTRADVLSWRPGHTRRLADGLETPVSLTVRAADDREAVGLLRDVQVLVFAGGPIMDLPRVLARHLALATAARRRQVPIVIDRVGIGPFTRNASRWAARRLVQLAGDLSVRTTASAADPVVAGLGPKIRSDPAFEYLDGRAELSRLGADTRRQVAALLGGSRDRLRVGINLRLIRHLWSPDGEAYSRRSEERFVDRLAEAMVVLAGTARRAPRFVFFPMNPQECGYSDLRAAYHLQRRLAGGADLRVWEADLDVDDILYLLRQMDAVVAMRFHACIFALSQNRPTLGIDYYPGQGGKVEQLFEDVGRPEAVRRMDRVETDWLVQAISRLVDRTEPAGHE